MPRQNEFGEIINDEELVILSKRIQKLSAKKIDELWYKCKFIISDREKKYRAIRQIDIDRIKGCLNSAKETLWNLLTETKFQDFKKNLDDIDKL